MSAFVKESAKKLLRYKNPETVLETLRQKYSFTSYVTAVSQVRRECMRIGVRHESYPGDVSVVRRACPDAYASEEFQNFVNADAETQSRMQKHCQRTFSVTRVADLARDSPASACIASIRLVPEHVRALRVTDAEVAWSKSRRDSALTAKSSRSIVVLDASLVVSEARKSMTSTNYFVALVGLGVVTGRRMVELAKTGSFEETPCEYSARFHGQAKVKFAEYSSADSYVIPILAPYHEVLECVTRLRSSKAFSGQTNEQVHASIAARANAAAKTFFDESLFQMTTEPTFHNTRVVYGTLSFQAFEHGCSINLWLKNVLGHESLETSLNYTSCSSTSPPIWNPPRKICCLGNNPVGSACTRCAHRCSDEAGRSECTASAPSAP